MDEFFEGLAAGVGQVVGYLLAEIVFLLSGWQGLAFLFLVLVGGILWFG